MGCVAIQLRVEGSGVLAPSFLFPDTLCDPGDHDAIVVGRFLVLPHAGRGMSIVTTQSEWYALSGSMGNPSKT